VYFFGFGIGRLFKSVDLATANLSAGNQLLNLVIPIILKKYILCSGLILVNAGIESDQMKHIFLCVILVC
jgi:hypothetical protein